ncbi:MAG: glucosamine-6-phosphate deaminase, partial [Elusimicrobia bacterium]|nr:glucosamine-6-phosphate deaminase [Elusimicrobiota bacterium]MBD3411645.1 glucosamine-6-phosphate deaminase [Elusimicrobiota bacterium]
YEIDIQKPYNRDPSFGRFLYEELFKHIMLPGSHIHTPASCSQNPEQSCSAYEQTIQRCGGIDLQLLGIGRNGHIGFNEPGSSFDSRTRIVELNEQTRMVNFEKFFKPAHIPFTSMPRHAVTAGIGTIMEAKKIIMLANGQDKTEAVKAMLCGPYSEDVPASVLQKHHDATLITDVKV